jgi:hypothetical protein
MAKAPLNLYRPWAEVLEAKGMEIVLAGDYFYSISRRDDDGGTNLFVEGEGFSRAQFEASVIYGVSRKLMLACGGRYRQNYSDTLLDDKSILATNSSGLESVFLDTQYQFSIPQKWKLGLRGKVGYALFSNQDLNPPYRDDALILGDDGVNLLAEANLSKQQNKRLFLSLKIGFQMPGRNLSREILYGAEASYVLKRYAFRAGMLGVESLQTDGYSADPQNKPTLPTGSTHLYNSINRSYYLPFGGINYQINSRWRLEVEYAHQFGKISTDSGHQGMLKLVWRDYGKTDRKLAFEKFKEYRVEATVTRVSPRGRFLRIDKGISDDFHKGMNVDIYYFDYLGANELVAQGEIYQVAAENAIVKVKKMLRRKKIKVGFVVRGNPE